ncbi:unnamed protein product [Albugo candida]|uniref:phenylalanine--tRNA ligase n=2 Tax=Albugo candida TaxID=65357 RepID=A0A024GJM9_9STRA|nr:unnamed protein product [Albugo candida]|eukprot:CCI46962.1 unnamed protein product [Albugo candida]
MLIPKDHISRRSTDSYYLNADTVLRTHMSAHDIELIQRGDRAFLATGDVYRRDAIDACHYPVFHQMDAVRFDPNLVHKATREEKVDIVKNDLKQTLEGMIAALFGQVDTRWVDAYFPFTEPSYELEIYFEGQWLEVLGCGVLQQQIIRDAGMGEEVAWAFGLGLERLAMVLFKIPDIRLFWSQDERFLSQFREGTITNFKPYSQYPECYKDVSFWHETDTFHENDLFEIIRNIAGDLVEKVILVDEFCHPKTQRQSKCFRIMYRHMDRNLTNAEVDQVQKQVRDQLHVQLKLDLR